MGISTLYQNSQRKISKGSSCLLIVKNNVPKTYLNIGLATINNKIKWCHSQYNGEDFNFGEQEGRHSYEVEGVERLRQHQQRLRRW